jgi:coenzyme PQQ synthesis protein D (PqqD)
MSETISWDNVYRKNSNIVARKIADEVILVPIRGNLADMQRIFSLNTLAEFIWNSLDGQRPLRDIRNDISDNFEVEESTAKKDISELIDQLMDYNLIAAVS